MAQIECPLFEGINEALAHRVPGIMLDLHQQALHRTDHCIRQAFIGAGEAQQPVGALRHLAADIGGFIDDRRQPPFDSGIDQQFVAASRHQRVHRFGNDGGQLHGLQPAAGQIFHRLGNDGIIQPVDQLANQRGNALLAVRAFRRRRGQPARQHAGQIGIIQPAGNDLGFQEIVFQELGQGFAQPVLLLRDDGGVRDRQTQRMTEQRGDGEPVGKAAHHRRFTERHHPRHSRMRLGKHQADDENHGHRCEQQRRHQAHPVKGRFRQQAVQGVITPQALRREA